jgi:hypothetical protein
MGSSNRGRGGDFGRLVVASIVTLLLVATIALSSADDADLADPLADGGAPTLDGGTRDGGWLDGGLLDGGRPDAGWLDGGLLDGGARDGGRPDGGRLDGGLLDGGRRRPLSR